MLDYLISHLSGCDMNGLDYGAIAGFMAYRVLQNTIKRIWRKVERIIVIYLAIFIGFKLWQWLL